MAQLDVKDLRNEKLPASKFPVDARAIFACTSRRKFGLAFSSMRKPTHRSRFAVCW